MGLFYPMPFDFIWLIVYNIDIWIGKIKWNGKRKPGNYQAKNFLRM